MIRNTLENLQKNRKRKYLTEIPRDEENEANIMSAQIDENDVAGDVGTDSIESQTSVSTVRFLYGRTERGAVCLWFQGYRFTHNKGKWWRCTNRDCPAYAVITKHLDEAADGTLGPKEHTHLPQPQKKQAEAKRLNIKERVRVEPRLKPSRLLAEVRRSATEETYVSMSSDSALSVMMRREKKKILGNIDSFDPLSFVIPPILSEKRGENIVLYDSRTVRQGEKDVVLIFGSEKTLDILRQNNGLWHLDGTFKCSPAMWEQCFVVAASVHHRMCIGLWSLLPGKHRHYYEEVLNFLGARVSPTTPTKVLCDFEKAEIVAVSAVFPNTNIMCCMFHYGQSLYRNMKRLRLVQMYGEQSVRGEATRNTFRSILSLPLLPPNFIRRAFSIIVDSAPAGMEQFFLYFTRTYIGMTQRQIFDGANAFEAEPNIFSPLVSFSSILDVSTSFVASDHSYSRPPMQFGINSPSSTFSQHSQLVQYSLSPSSTATVQPALPWEEPVVRQAMFPIPFWNMHSHAASALARTNNGLEATHLHFMKGLCHHPALSDFICEVKESTDRQVDAARSARTFLHKRHKRYILQDAVIMRTLANATYNGDGEIHDLMTALGLQVEGYAGKLRDFENFDDSIVHVP